MSLLWTPRKNTKVETARHIYSNLETQIKQKSKDNKIILGGDCNVKLQVNKDSHEQAQSRNGKILQEMIDNTLLVPASTKANYGFYTKVNRKDTKENSMIDYILTTTPIATNISSLIIDDEGQHQDKKTKRNQTTTQSW